MATEQLVLPVFYNPGLVLLSVLISILGAYAAFDLIERLRDARGRARLAWLAGGATADAIGIWSMHYTGMMAFNLPMPVLYDVPMVLVSLLVGITGSAAALAVLGRSKIGWGRVMLASILVGGIGISGLHYTAMGSMRFQGMHHYVASLVVLSVLLATLFYLMGVSLGFVLRGGAPRHSWRGHGSAVLRGLANPVMHYTSMAGTIFIYSAQPLDVSHAVDVTALGVAGISIVPVMLLLVVVITSAMDRTSKQRALLDELFEQGPQSVALTRVDGGIVRVNREFTRMFGYTPQEAIGRRLAELITPDVSQEEEEQYARAVAGGQSVQAEGVRQRKDGSRLEVAMLRVPVSMPGGEIEVYAIYRDITEAKRADEALRQSAERLQTLSRRLVEIQESERRELSRELHDRIGQNLTALKINLDIVLSELPAAIKTAQGPRMHESLELIDATVRSVEEVMAELRPPMLDDHGLLAALRWIGGQFSRRAGIPITVQGPGDLARLAPAIEIALYRIMQEALTNVTKHAHASHVTISLTVQPGNLELVVADDGDGFDANAASRRGSAVGWGLITMRERAEAIGGILTIESAPSRGTRLIVTIAS
jgi:PAS domain S-box-containing protein